MSASLAAGEAVSVVWGSGSRHEVRRAVIVEISLHMKDFLRERVQSIVHMRLHYDPPRPTSYNDSVELLSDEGRTWCRGWEGPQVDALKTVAALSQ